MPEVAGAGVGASMLEAIGGGLNVVLNAGSAALDGQGLHFSPTEHRRPFLHPCGCGDFVWRLIGALVDSGSVWAIFSVSGLSKQVKEISFALVFWGQSFVFAGGAVADLTRAQVCSAILANVIFHVPSSISEGAGRITSSTPSWVVIRSLASCFGRR